MNKQILTILIIVFNFNLVQLHGQTYFNIEKFGVSGVDNNDDTKLFDKAIEFISKNGGTLFIPKGNYYLNNSERNRKGIYNNSYIFIVSSDFKIILDKDAKLFFRNGFKGFRFRSTKDPNEKTINKFSIEIYGGKINGKNNYTKKTSNNPNVWCFVGETLKSFKVTNLKIFDFYGSAGIASYSNDFVEISDNYLYNVTGNPYDMIDNHGDGIYIANTKKYNVKNNNIINRISENNRIGRIGICIEYEQSGNGIISENTISGYDRGVHIELIKGTAIIHDNKLSGNSSGIVLWNNYRYKQIIDSNIIDNIGLSPKNRSILYTSAPILMLGYNTNNNSIIRNNSILIESKYFIPANLLQVTSSDIQVYDNKLIDKSETLELSIAQGYSNNKKVKNIDFRNNLVNCKSIMVYDGSNVSVDNNTLKIKEGVLSFDNSNNYLRNNIIDRNSSIKTFGNFMK